MSRRFSDFPVNDDVDVDGNRWETWNIHVSDTPTVLSMWHWRGTEINRFELKMIALHIQSNRQRSTPFSSCVKVGEIPACSPLVKVFIAKNQMIVKFYYPTNTSRSMFRFLKDLNRYLPMFAAAYHSLHSKHRQTASSPLFGLCYHRSSRRITPPNYACNIELKHRALFSPNCWLLVNSMPSEFEKKFIQWSRDCLAVHSLKPSRVWNLSLVFKTKDSSWDKVFSSNIVQSRDEVRISLSIGTR